MLITVMERMTRGSRVCGNKPSAGDPVKSCPKIVTSLVTYFTKKITHPLNTKVMSNINGEIQ